MAGKVSSGNSREVGPVDGRDGELKDGPLFGGRETSQRGNSPNSPGGRPPPEPLQPQRTHPLGKEPGTHAQKLKDDLSVGKCLNSRTGVHRFPHVSLRWEHSLVLLETR